MADATYFRRGFGLKAEIADLLSTDYHSHLVELLRGRGHVLTVGSLTFRLAKEFGFCYGVDRAVDYAYESRVKFPDRRLFLVGEIIHNPHVNAKLASMGVIFLHRPEGREFDFSSVRADDVVILPAFGVTVGDFARLREIGCVLVDTTCGSVLNVWKRVESYARDGFTAVIHGKHWHEETKATASQVTRHQGGRYLVVLNMAEARQVIDFVEHGGDPAPLLETFAGQASPGFDFERDLDRVGFANQTTMLMTESLAIAEAFKAAMVRKHGEAEAAQHVRTFDTICSATQERQDAVVELLEDPPDLMVVIGGYNSSNTTHLAKLCASRGLRTFHIEDAAGVDPGTGLLRHQAIGTSEEAVAEGWLDRIATIGITAGASTPNNKIGETIVRICAVAGLSKALEEALGAP